MSNLAHIFAHIFAESFWSDSFRWEPFLLKSRKLWRDRLLLTEKEKLRLQINKQLKD